MGDALVKHVFSKYSMSEYIVMDGSAFRKLGIKI